MPQDLPINDALVLPANMLRLQWTTSRGPGGQNVNKRATCAQLRLNVTEAPLPERVKRRLRDRHKLTRDGALLVQVDTHRSAARNLEQARTLLAAHVRRALVDPRRRKKTRPKRGAIEARLRAKRATSDRKVKRRKPDLL